MLNAILSIAESSHQGHERFSEISRGRQCSFMSFSALSCMCVQSFPVQHWDTATVDQILIEGDRMYLNALESQRITDTDSLSLIYLPNLARSTVQSPAIEVTEQNQSPVEVTKSPSEANECSKTLTFKRDHRLHCDYIFNLYFKMKGCLLFPNVSGIFIFKGEHSPQYDYTCSHCVSKNSLSIWRTLIPRFLSVTWL